LAAQKLQFSLRILCGHSMASKLTDGVVKALPAPRNGSLITYDTVIKGFGIRVTSTGARSFVLNYRTWLGRERRYTIGAFPDWKTAPARAEATELKKRIDRGGDPLGEIIAGRAAPTVADLADRFEAEYLPRRRLSTQQTYRGQIASEIKPALGRLKVAQVTFADIDGLHRTITKRGRPYRANRVLALLSGMFSMAIRWHLRSDNPCKGIERNQEHKRRRYLSVDELRRLATALTALHDRQSADIIRLLLLTGARRGETLQARWDDIDLAAGIWNKPGATTKQKTIHTVPLSEAARRLLADIHDRPPPSKWVFPAAAGGPRRDVKDAWATVCRAANIRGARLHDLRHTYASVLASAGLSLPVIGALLGHATPVTTARYSHLFDDPLRVATERASAILTGAAPAEVVPLPVRK
jgi:integrase